MRKTRAIAAVVSILLFTSAVSANWSSFVIRNAGGGDAPTIDDLGGNTKEFIIDQSGMKAGWGTNDANGLTVGDLLAISIQRLDDFTRFAANTGAYYAPYINIWITNGAGKYAVIANEPSNPEWIGQSEWNMTWNDLKTKTLKVYENDDKSWLPSNGVGLTFNDVAGFQILAPTSAELTGGWAGLGTGAPRELGTNVAYGFNWIFGDTLSNYVSGDPGYKVKDPTITTAVVPAPGATLLALIGLPIVGWVKRRMA